MSTFSTFATEFANRWFDRVWNNSDDSAIDEMCHPDAQVFGFPEPHSVSNRDGFRGAIQKFRSIFSSINIKVEQVIADNDRIAIHWSATMIHTGDGLNVPPTNEKASLSGASIVHLKDGKICKAR